VSKYFENQGWGKRTVSYRIRDWLISRQRYWGAPIPMLYCDKCGIVPVPEKDLPVLLPEEAEFKPTGESPLKYNEKWVNTKCPKCGGPAKRETDTMDTFMCSNWYYLRYVSPHFATAPFDTDKVKKWCPVDIYTGGAEHAVMHLLYARFFGKVVRDMGLVSFDEPFKKLFNQGVIIADKQKMSKSKGNVITPDTYVNDIGADAVRVYLMFLGPWEEGGEWDDSNINGVTRWLNRVWSLALEPYNRKSAHQNGKALRELQRVTHRTIKKATGDIEGLQFNTMVAALMEFTNYLSKVKESGDVDPADWDESISALLRMMAPSTPHFGEELWQLKGYQYSIHNQSWPKWDEKLVAEEEITLVIQINGKLRDRLIVPASITEDKARHLAMQSDKVKANLENRELVNVIYVPGRLINIVVK
jgi:leucyl-tRNA synthetase